MSEELTRDQNQSTPHPHAYCLNALVEMQNSHYYAVRRDVLREAGGLIVRYVDENVSLRARLDEQMARIKELEERLEISFAFNAMGVRVPVPKTVPDDIECRDVTIKIQDEQIAILRAQLDVQTQLTMSNVNNCVTLQVQLNEQTERAEQVETELSGVNATLRRQEEAVNDLTAKLKTMTQERDEWKQSFSDSQVGYEDRRCRYNRMEKALAAMTQERGAAMKQMALQKEVADNQTWHVQDLRRQLTASEQRVRELELDASIGREANQRLRTKVLNAEHYLTEAQATIARLEQVERAAIQRAD